MPKLLITLNLNELTCVDTCYGPGADTVYVYSELYDTTVPAVPVLIPGTTGGIGPFRMDKKGNIKPGDKAVATVGQTNIFRNVTYARPPIPPGALPDTMKLTVNLIKGDAEVRLLPIPVTINVGAGPAKATAEIDLGAPISVIVRKIIDLVESQVIGNNTHQVNPQAAKPPNGQKFTDTDTGEGAEYKLVYSLTIDSMT